MKSLLLVTMLSVGTALTTMGRLKPVSASLTAPTSYDYSYTWNATDSEQYLNVNGVDSIPLYTRTADGVYYDYVSTFNVIDGLDVTMDFQRSNTTWQSSGISYKPDEDKIGSDNTVGDIGKKFNLIFDNQTNKDYLLYLDLSTTNMTIYADLLINNNKIITTSNNRIVLEAPASQLYKFYLSAYSNNNIYSTAWFSQARYFDAWYLQDLGISDSFQAGLDAETDGILTDYLGTDAQQIGWVLIGIAAILFAFKGGK
jgi:hypothetical protein